MKNKYILSVAIGVLLLVSSMVMGMIVNTIFPSLMTEYAGPVFRQMDDPMWMLFLVYPIAFGVLLTYVWLRTKKSWKDGMDYGLATGVFLAVPMLLVNLSSFAVSTLMAVSWSVFGFVNCLIAGLVLEKLDD